MCGCVFVHAIVYTQRPYMHCFFFIYRLWSNSTCDFVRRRQGFVPPPPQVVVGQLGTYNQRLHCTKESKRLTFVIKIDQRLGEEVRNEVNVMCVIKAILLHVRVHRCIVCPPMACIPVMAFVMPLLLPAVVMSSSVDRFATWP